MKTILMIMVVGMMVCGASKCEDVQGGNYNTYDGGVDDSGSDTDTDVDSGYNCSGTCHWGLDGAGCPLDYLHCPGQTCPTYTPGLPGHCCGLPGECSE